jgi:hypothetical protein
VNLFQYDKAYREALAAFEALRKLGFSPEDIFFLTSGADEETKHISVVLLTQGKEFVITTGTIRGSVEEIEKTWKELAGLLASGKIPKNQLDTSWRKSMAHTHAYEFMLAILKKGIQLPSMLKTLN